MDIDKLPHSQVSKLAAEAKIDSRPKVLALGLLPPEREGKSVTIRMCSDTDEWLNSRVKGNKSLAIAAMLDFAIKKVDEEIEKKGEFNLKRWLKNDF